MGLNNPMMKGLGMESDSEDGQDSLGLSSSWMMMPLMLSLMEKLLALDTQTQLSSTGESLLQQTKTQAESLHINQFDAERQAGGDGINANCGPASLVIALHALGLKVKGEEAGASLNQSIDLARKSMVSDPLRDGVDESGLRAESEHNTFTNFSDLLQGAQASGAKASIILPKASSVQATLQKGGTVIVSGTFVDKSPLPWTGNSEIDNNSAPGFATEHLIAITAYNAQTKKFTVNDPARRSTLQVDGTTLEYFMSGNAGAMALFS